MSNKHVKNIYKKGVLLTFVNQKFDINKKILLKVQYTNNSKTHLNHLNEKNGYLFKLTFFMPIACLTY